MPHWVCQLPALAATSIALAIAAAPATAQDRPATQPDQAVNTASDRDSTGVSVAAPPPAKPDAPASAGDAALHDGLGALGRDILGAPFSVDLTIGQFAERVGATAALQSAIQSAEQPGGPRWRDGVCELRVELPGSAVAKVLADAAKSRSAGMPAETLERRLAHLRTQRYSAIGRSRTPPPPARPAPPVTAPSPLIPTDPPRWVRDQMDADGRGGGPGLKGARAGEAVALSQLRTQVNALPLSADVTVAQAARQDDRVDTAVTTALRQARVSRVIYADDAVEVRVSFDLAHLWRELVRIR